MTLEDYDSIHIYCSIYYYEVGFPGRNFKYSVSWYNKDGDLVKGNLGDASTRAEATKKVIAMAKKIKDGAYNFPPKAI